MTRQRLLLIMLLAWALVMIVPDVLRVVQPLGSFGFYADNDGVIYDVTGPFDAESDSPAWKAGIRDGDRLALSRLRCFPYDRTTCRNALMVLGGLQLALPGRQATFELKATDGDRMPPAPISTPMSAMLERIAQNTAAVYAEIENDELRRQVSTLERKLSRTSMPGSGAAKRPKRNDSPDSPSKAGGLVGLRQSPHFLYTCGKTGL